MPYFMWNCLTLILPADISQRRARAGNNYLDTFPVRRWRLFAPVMQSAGEQGCRTGLSIWPLDLSILFPITVPTYLRESIWKEDRSIYLGCGNFLPVAVRPAVGQCITGEACGQGSCSFPVHGDLRERKRSQSVNITLLNKPLVTCCFLLGPTS